MCSDSEMPARRWISARIFVKSADVNSKSRAASPDRSCGSGASRREAARAGIMA
ncbi:putative chemotaxis protein methyltransferase [Burkholderia mallei]|nr:MCP methyltransferase, CheR-type domain protein [Burkholderia mallei]KOT19124.1 putative chemotaxis protein methyltransferase [Burkholderia mallei]KOT22964.1 putative chemotaxis protein methyltransferase [Burkholderia mallei]